MNIRERLESMLRPNADGLLPCDNCASWIKNQRLLRALRLAIDQRDHYFADLREIELVDAEQGVRFQAKDNAALLAILEGKVTT